MPAEPSGATRLVGPNPRGALSRVSLAVRRALAGLPAGAPVVVGLSGGADSLALALAAVDLGTRSGRRVVTATIDHGLRPESAREARSVAALARGLGAEALVERVEVGADGGPEGAARDARREALARIAREVGGPVLLGHTRDDQAETVLLRLARGSGAASLRAMSPDSVDEGGVRWIRPLLDLARADTEEACRQAGLDPVRDPSNLPDGPWRASDGSALRRAAVRAAALPALARALGADPVPALARTAELAARDDDALGEWAEAVWSSARVSAEFPDPDEPPGPAGHPDPAGPSDVKPSDPARSSAIAEHATLPGAEPPDETSRPDPPVPALAVDALVDLPIAVRTRVLRRFALEAGARPGDLSSAHLDALDALVADWRGQGPIPLPGAAIRRLRDSAGRPVLVADDRPSGRDFRSQ